MKERFESRLKELGECKFDEDYTIDQIHQLRRLANTLNIQHIITFDEFDEIIRMMLDWLAANEYLYQYVDRYCK